MFSILLCVVVLIGLIMLFYLCGVVFHKILKNSATILEKIVIGFFVYFSIFHIVSFPMILLAVDLSTLEVVWGTILILMVGAALYLFYRAYRKNNAIKNSGIKNLNNYIIIIVVLVLIQCVYTSLAYYVTWDASAYIGMIQSALETDKMFVYNADGHNTSSVILRYALSTYYMHSAVLCRLFNLHPILLQRYVLSPICIILSTCVIYLIAKKVFRNNKDKSLITVIIANLLMTCYTSLYTPSTFLMSRAQEAKTFCGNIILPMLIYVWLCYWRDSSNKNFWSWIFLIGFVSVPISMSALLSTPIVIFSLVVAKWLNNKDKNTIIFGVICLIPNIMYIAMYYLYSIGIFQIKVI